MSVVGGCPLEAAHVASWMPRSARTACPAASKEQSGFREGRVELIMLAVGGGCHASLSHFFCGSWHPSAGH